MPQMLTQLGRGGLSVFTSRMIEKDGDPANRSEYFRRAVSNAGDRLKAMLQTAMPPLHVGEVSGAARKTMRSLSFAHTAHIEIFLGRIDVLGSK